MHGPTNVKLSAHIYVYLASFYIQAWWLSGITEICSLLGFGNRDEVFTARYELRLWIQYNTHCTHLRQQCHNSKCVIFQERLLKVLKCYIIFWVQRRHNYSPAASFVNCVMTLHLLKVRLQTLLSITVTQKCQILSCDILVANEQNISLPVVI